MTRKRIVLSSGYGTAGTPMTVKEMRPATVTWRAFLWAGVLCRLGLLGRLVMGLKPREVIEGIAGFRGGREDGFAVPFQGFQPNRDIRRVIFPDCGLMADFRHDERGAKLGYQLFHRVAFMARSNERPEIVA
jgi:hypothetical protein